MNQRQHKIIKFSLGKHRSNALELIQKQPVIEVDGDMAICDGGGGALGHPLEYIKVGNRADYESPEDYEKGVACIYCGLRYRKKQGSGHWKYFRKYGDKCIDWGENPYWWCL